MIIKACPGHPLLLGRLGENLALEIVFTDEVVAWLSEYPNAAIGLLNQRPGDTQGYPVARAVVSGGALHWTVTNTDLSAEGNGKCELVATDNGVVVKSAIYDTIILTALDGSGETPKPWEDWREYFIEMKDEAEGSAEAAAGSATAARQSAEDAATSAAAAQESAEAIQDMGVESETLPPGSPLSVVKTIDPETGVVTLTFHLVPGQDGVSPTATVTQTSTGATISITDAEGTTTAEIANGQDGAPGDPGTDGISPTVTVTDITGGHRVTITDATGPHSFDVMDGEGAVQDVQVNGVSVLQDGVANVPVASSAVLGAVKVNAGYGIQIDASGLISTYPATLSDIKSGGPTRPVISPTNQHISTFYGLAKAAGDTTQSASSNPVGTYTENAKSAIQTMLGLSEILGPVEGTTASTAYSIGDAFLHGGALYKAITAIASGEAIVPGTNCVQTTIINLIKGV
jgi:hypothetical protein